MTLETRTTPGRRRPQGMPALEQLPTGPRTAVSAAVARRLFRAAVARLDVTVVEAPTGRTFGRGGPLMRLHRPEEFYARVGRDGLIGFGEAYLTGAWDADDLAGFLTVPAARMADAGARSRCSGSAPSSMPRLPHHQRSTEANSQANISHHYDLSNELFALFLDETLSYSSALFDTSVLPAGPAPAPSVTTWSPLHQSPPTTGTRPSTAPTSRTRRAARSNASSTRPASPPAPGSWRSAPGGASSPSVPPGVARASTRSRCRSSSSSSPRSGSPRPGSPTASRSS